MTPAKGRSIFHIIRLVALHSIDSSLNKPDEGDGSVELQQYSPVLLQSEFQQFHGKSVRLSRLPLPSGARSRGHSQRVLLRQALWDVGMEHFGFRVQQRAEESHPISRGYTSFVSQSSLPPSLSSRVCTAIRPSSSPPAVHRFDVFERIPRWPPMALEEANDCCTWNSLRPVTHAYAYNSVHFQAALTGCVHRTSRSSSFRSGVSTPTSLGSPSLLGWGHHQFNGSHDGRGECGFHVVHTAISWFVRPKLCLPTAVATSCRS